MEIECLRGKVFHSRIDEGVISINTIKDISLNSRHKCSIAMGSPILATTHMPTIINMELKPL